MYGIVEERENETWYMIRGKAFTPNISEKYPIQTFETEKEAEDALYWLDYRKPVNPRNYKIIKVKHKYLPLY